MQPDKDDTTELVRALIKQDRRDLINKNGFAEIKDKCTLRFNIYKD